MESGVGTFESGLSSAFSLVQPTHERQQKIGTPRNVEPQEHWKSLQEANDLDCDLCYMLRATR